MVGIKGKSSHRGTLLIAGIALFGAAVLVLFFKAPTRQSHAPRDVPFRFPDRALRFVTIDIRSTPGGIDAAIAQLSQSKPDFAFVQGIEGRDVGRIVRAIGANADDPQLTTFYPAQNLNGSNSTWGNLVASRHRLFEGRSMPNRGGSFGVWAVAVAYGAKFCVGSANFSEPDAPQKGDVHKEVAALVRAYESVGRPPIVIGVRGVAVDGTDVSVLKVARLIVPGPPPGAGFILTSIGWETDDLESSVSGTVQITKTPREPATLRTP